MKYGIVIALCVTIGLVASGNWLGFGQAEAADTTPTTSRTKVQRGDLRIVVEENGYLTAKDNVKISPKFKGSGTITVLIDEGDSVVPGDVLIEFDKTNLETQISELENSLVQYEIEREAAKANLEIQERDNEATIEKAELTLELAKLTLQRYKEGDEPNESRKLDLAVEKAVSAHERARERFEEVPALVQQGFFTRIEEEEERIKVREAEINEENARKDLELHETFTKPMELTKKQSEVTDAERQLENARKKADINLKEKQASLAQRERQVTSTESRLEEKRGQLEHFTIKAENPGIVHYGDPERPWWRDDIKVGSNVYQGRTLITIPDLTTMQVLLQVHEADIDQIALDQEVIVTVDARKGESFKGKITEIASVATSANWTDETNKTFKVKVTLDEASEDMRAGVTAKAQIEIETLEDVLYVPIHAIVGEADKHLAFVVAGNEIEEREVKIGKNNSHFVVVLEGLSEGDEILLYDPRTEGGPTKSIPGAPSESEDDAVLPGAPAG